MKRFPISLFFLGSKITGKNLLLETLPKGTWSSQGKEDLKILTLKIHAKITHQDALKYSSKLTSVTMLSGYPVGQCPQLSIISIWSTYMEDRDH